MLEQNVQLSADEHYKIFVDFGPQVQSSLPRLAQQRSSLALGQPRNGSSDCGSLEQSKSPVRVTFKKLDHSETRFKQSPEKQAAVQSQMDQESAMCGVYDQFLNNKTVVNNHMMSGKDNKSSLNQCLVPISPSQALQKSSKDKRYNMSESWKAFTLTVEQQNLEEKSMKLKQQARRVSSAKRHMRDQSGLRSQLYKVKGATEQIPREQHVRAGRAQTTMQESQEKPILYGQNHLAVSYNAIQFKQTDTEEISKGEGNQQIDVQIMNEDELRLHDEYSAIIHTHSPENKSLAKVEQEHLANTRNDQKRSATMQISSSLDPSNRWLVAPSSNISRLASVSRLHEVDSSKRGNRALSTSQKSLPDQNLGTNREKSAKSRRSTKSRKSSCQQAAEEQGFNAESYAAKKKLLSEMIDALESAREVHLKEKSGSRSFGRNTIYNAQSSMQLQPKFSHKQFTLPQKKSITRKHSPSQYQIRQVTRSSMSKGGMTQLRKSQESSTYLGETWRQKPQSLVTPENNDTIAENQKMMMNTLDARSKNQIMSNFKKLRRIKMPKPKTVDQLIADSLKRNRKVVVADSQIKVATVKAVENSYCHTEMLQNQSNTNSTAHVNIQDQRIVKQLSKSKVLDARISQDKDVIAINKLLNSDEFETDQGLKQENQTLYQQMHNQEPAKSNARLEILTASQQKQAEFRPSSQSVKSSLQMPFRGSTGTVNQKLFQAKSGTPNEESAVRRKLQKPYKVTVNQDEQRVSSVITHPKDLSTINRNDLVATEYLHSQKELQTVSLKDKLSKKSDQLDPTLTKMTDQAADFGQLSCSPNFGLQTVEGTVKASSISSHIKLTGLKSKNIQIETPSPVHSEDEDQQEPSHALDKEKLAQAMQDAKNELGILKEQDASIEVQQLTHEEYSKVGDKTFKSHKNHRKMLTINYFGNIQDSLIGQIKTKIPISKKHEYARTFHSPKNQSFPDAEAEYKPLVQSLTTPILIPAPSGDQQEQPDQRPGSQTSQDNNARIFYANIGHEPYIVNKYVRPKGLHSFQLVNNQSEAEMEYQKRKELYMLEQDLKSHYEILQKQKKALRGTMFKDPLSALSKRKSIQDLKSNQVLKPSASLPAISVDTSQTTTFRLGEKPPLDSKFIKKQKSLIPGGGGSVIVEHAGQIRMQRSQSKIEIASPSLAHKNKQRDGPNNSSVSRRKKGYLNFAEREFLETQNLNTQEITLEYSDDLDATAKQKLPRIRQKQTGQSTPNSAANHSFNSKAMLTEFIKKEASSAAQSPFDMEISMVSPNNADLTRSGIHIEISPKKNANQMNDQQQQRIDSESVQSDMQQTANFGKSQQDMASQQTGPGETNSRYQPSSTWLPQQQRQMRSSLGENGRETVYSALSQINNNGEIYIETKITKSPNRKAANSLGVSRTIGRPSEKSKSFAGRNSTLSHTVKFGKLNASLCAHSHAEQIKSFIKQRHSEVNPPKLLGRGTEKFMGRSSMFKGMPMSCKKQKGLFQNTILANQDQTTIRDSQTISHQDDDDLFNSISHLLPKTNKSKSILKKQLRMNQNEYRNSTTGFSQSLRQSAHEQKDVNSSRINGDEIQGELYLRFLKYKNQQTSIDQQTA